MSLPVLQLGEVKQRENVDLNREVVVAVAVAIAVMVRSERSPSARLRSLV